MRVGLRMIRDQPWRAIMLLKSLKNWVYLCLKKFVSLLVQMKNLAGVIWIITLPITVWKIQTLVSHQMPNSQLSTVKKETSPNTSISLVTIMVLLCFIISKVGCVKTWYQNLRQLSSRHRMILMC